MQTLKRAMIKEELVALTGDLEKAIILNQLLYRSERVKDFDKFLMEEKMVAEINRDIDRLELINGWIYKDMEELKEETMITYSISTLSRKMNDLIKSGWIYRRRNPKHRWDKRYQYRVNLIKISMDLIKIGYTLQGYKIDLQMLINANLQNDSSNLHSDGAISEITTETTIEITSETTTTTIDEENKNCCYSDSENKELETDENLSVIAKEFEQSRFGTINIKVKELLEELLEEYSVEWIM